LNDDGGAMAITIDILRRCGITDTQIVEILRVEQEERLAKVREQNRIRQQNHRSRNDVTRDMRDMRDKRKVSPDPSKDLLSSYPSDSHKEERPTDAETCAHARAREWPVAQSGSLGRPAGRAIAAKAWKQGRIPTNPEEPP
jgi:hypothetical protein